MIILTRKKQNEILNRLCANRIIYSHAMNALPSCDEWFDCMDKFIGNSVDIAIMIGGIDGALKIRNTLIKRNEELKEQKNE